MTGRLVGIDVGGTKCLGVALATTGEQLAAVRVPTPNNPDQLIATLAKIADELGADDTIGVAVPGLVNRDGVLLAAPNITSVRMLPLRQQLEQATGLKVIVDNDNTVACLGEWRLGAGRGSDDLLLVGLGTGIGGGFVSGGKLQRGANGFAGEFGHMIVDPDGISCLCGQRGCWERYASGNGLAQHARRAASDGLLDAILDQVGSVEAIHGEHITVAARFGDSEACAVVDTYAGWVALGLVNLTNLYDPAMIVMSGGLSGDADVFLDAIQQSFVRRIFATDLRPLPLLRFAELGPHAGAVGAALLTIENKE